MDADQKAALWHRYTTVWRGVLAFVLLWELKRADEYIEDLRLQMESRIDDPYDFGFFYDSPCYYLFRPILGNGLHERIMSCESEEANPVNIYQRLVIAIALGVSERDLEKLDFDWAAARMRYQTERQAVEAWLSSLE